MQIKSTMRYYFTPIKMAKFKSLVSGLGKDVEQ